MTKKKKSVNEEVNDFLKELEETTEIDIDDIDLDDDDDLEGEEEEEFEEEEGEEEEEEVEIKPKKTRKTRAKTKAKAKPKKRGRKKVKVENEEGESLSAEVLTEDEANDIVIEDEEGFDPKVDGQQVQEAWDQINQSWFTNIKKIGAILCKAAKFYKGKRQEFEKWLRKYMNKGYSTARQYIRIGQWSEETLSKIEALGWSSSHVMYLPSLGKEQNVEEFISQKTALINEDGDRKRLKDMDPKEVSAAVRQYKRDNAGTGKVREVSPEQLFKRQVTKVDRFFTDNWDDFKKNLRTKGVSEVEPETIKALKRIKKALMSLEKMFDKLNEKYC